MRFETVKPAPPARRGFEVGARIRCIDASGTDLMRGRAYTVVPYQISVDSAGLSDASLVYVRREGRAEGDYPARFRLIEEVRRDRLEPRRLRVIPAPEPEPPGLGTMAEYGPAAPEAVKPNPIFNAIGKKWPAHPSDVLITLDELKGEGR